MKTCSVCKKERLLSEFSKAHWVKGGLDCRCKKCRAEYYQSHKAETAAAGKAYSQTAAGKKKRREAKRKYRLDFPSKAKAHQKLANAVRHQRLGSFSCCESCFQEKPVDGHHEDYDKPLEVIWLCRGCHTKRHLESREILV